MSLPGPIAHKLALLIHGLANADDEEAVAVVAAMRRHLAAAGCDFHDLAARLTPPSAAPRSLEPVKLAMACLCRGGGLSSQEAHFLVDITSGCLGWEDLSEDQADYLCGLYGRLSQRAGAA